MKNKLLVLPESLADIEKLESVGVSTFLFPLEEFCVGHTQAFKPQEIGEYKNSYVLLNRLLDCKSVLKLETILPELKNVKGIVFEDIAVFNLVKKMGLKTELIWWQHHFGTSSEIINFWLENGVNSAFLSNEITKDEIKHILANSSKELIVQIFGYNEVMYSRRLLLTNYSEFYQEEKQQLRYLKDKKSDLSFITLENEWGTVFLNKKIYNGLDLINLDNIKYFYIDASLIDIAKIKTLIENIDNPKFDINSLELEMDTGFLNKETIYKLKEEAE